MKGTVIALVLVGALGVPAFADETEPAEPPVAPMPFYLEGIDLNQPAQHAFRGWPPEALRDRAYWLPWSRLAFQRASVLQQPVMLVLTVPWSLPSQKVLSESLSDVRVLRVANESVLMVLVNADRRPDIRDRYRTGVLPVIGLVLPNGMPMLSQANPTGMALPITLGYVRPDGLLFALQEGRVYFDRWQGLLSGIAQAYEARTGQVTPTSGSVRVESSDFFARWLLGNLDAEAGGFAPAPRAVLPGLGEYAAIRASRGLPALDEASLLTLGGVARSPLRDARDGGFHRMASLPDWKGIQYEKLLAVQAEFLRESSVELRRNDAEVVRAAARDTVRFLGDVLARPEGGFYQAQVADAGSVDGGGWWTEDRAGRAAPSVDRTVLTGPNASTGAALLRIANVLDDPRAAELGTSALRVVLEKGFLPGRGAIHALDGIGTDRRFLETQAETAFALEDAYESTGDERLLRASEDIAGFALRNLAREGEVALRDFLSGGSEIGLLAFPRWPARDNLRLARALIRLHYLGLGDGKLLARAREIIGAFPVDPALDGSAGIEGALAVEEATREPLVVTIDGPPTDEATRALRRAALTSRVVWSVVRTGAADASPRARLSREGRSEVANSPETLRAMAESMVPATAALGER